MGVDKGSVLQEKRIFNESPINPRKCCHLITKILYLLGQGQTFTKTEATDLFFATTMLFQSTDVPSLLNPPLLLGGRRRHLLSSHLIS